MTLTFIVVALLLLAAALLFLIPPMLQKNNDAPKLDRDEINVELYKDQLEELQRDLDSGVLSEDQFEKSKQDLERTLLEDVSGEISVATPEQYKGLVQNGVLAVAVFVPLLSVILYSQLGGGDHAFNPEAARNTVTAEGHKGTIEDQIRQLQEHLQGEPDDVEGWVMLARSYYFMKQYQAASDAFARASSLTGQADPNMLADYADALAMANGRTLMGQPYDLVKKALEVQPNHQKALWLAASATMESKDYKTSLGYWTTLLRLFPKGSKEYNQMLRNIGEVKQLAGEEIEPELLEEMRVAQQMEEQGMVTDAASQTSGGGAGVSGEVVLDPGFSAKVSPGDTLFIYAIAANGPRMPLAIVRKTAADLPFKFVLNDSNAMDPSMTISKFPEIVLIARVTKSADAMRQAGDLYGTTAPIKTGSQDLKIVIDKIIPEDAAAASPGGMSTQSSPAAAAATAPGSNSNAKVTGTISLDSSLSARVSPQDTVFVFARAANGPRMPLAIIRKQVKDLPIAFSLDDSMAMNPSMSLSKFSDVIVTARISKTGDAMPKSGDLKGSSSVIKVGAEGLKIIIDSAVP
ncbi:MAG: c-type cytochrome biogenesis protein CcmI [Gammaproteobacteria bacterium]|nr:c-type cytochrome biogenesis protein CcmI [Gammaproteobacteria bacterium]MDH5800839.1 c-type cytochrome biogenesis protein CcmI [Gammaproteobacteria bacterium]